MEALGQGVAFSLQLGSDGQTMRTAAIYSPGVRSGTGNLVHWVFWEIKRSMSSDGVRVWSARSYRRLDSGLLLSLDLAAFGGHCGVDTENLSDLLVAIGIGMSVRTATMMGQTVAFVRQKDGPALTQPITQIRSKGWFFTQAMADKAKRLAPLAQS